MKKVTFTSDIVKFSSFDEMLTAALIEGKRIGFIPDTMSTRYMIVLAGPQKGIAINEMGNWTTKEEQPEEKGQYFLFDNSLELYEWMSRTLA